jgi:hypothetical protein
MSNSGDPLLRFSAAQCWGAVSAKYGYLFSAAEAYKAMFDLLPHIVWLGATVSKRYNDMKVIGDTVSQAVAVTIKADNLPLALEWLEEGRSIVWGQMLQLRTPLDDLRARHPALASKLQHISFGLNNASVSTSVAQSDVWSSENEAQALRRLAEEWDHALQEVRKLNGFEDLLHPTKFTALSKSSQRGTIVCLTTHGESCDALVLPHRSADIIHVPLTRFTHATAISLRAKMTASLGDANARIGVAVRVPGILEDSLAALWSCVVKPVFEALGMRHPVVSQLFEDSWGSLTCRYRTLLSIFRTSSGVRRVH